MFQDLRNQTKDRLLPVPLELSRYRRSQILVEMRFVLRALFLTPHSEVAYPLCPVVIVDPAFDAVHRYFVVPGTMPCFAGQDQLWAGRQDEANQGNDWRTDST